ncbi:MAG: dTMP kinase [Opitutales bacterium]
MPGFFISFEGGEGCGKSTQIEALAKRIEAQGREVLRVREPGGTALGEAVRNLLQHDRAGDGMSPEAELLLFAASRAQLTRERIRPALNAGCIVLCDRFLDSTTVYQGVARALDPEAVASINRFAVENTLPDRTILLDIPAEEGLKRAQGRHNSKLDRIEQETVEFFKAVRKGYLQLAESEPERFRVLDALQPVKTLEAEIWNELAPSIA